MRQDTDFSTQISGRGWTITIHRHGQWLQMGVVTADTGWRSTDANGHEHYWEDNGYPTLNFVVDAEHWCDGREGMYNHDPHMAIDQSHYECKVCGVTVDPGTHGPEHKVHIPGRIDATLVGTRRDGLSVEIPLDFDEITALQAPEADHEAIGASILEGPIDRAYSIRFAGPPIASHQGSSPAPHDPSSDGGAGH